MRYKTILSLSAISALLMTGVAVSATASSNTAAFTLFAPLAESPSSNAWISSHTPPVQLAQSRDAFPPIGFDPSLPEGARQKPERAPVWPVSPVQPEPLKPLKIEPMRLLQAPKIKLAPALRAPQPLLNTTRSASPVRPVYPAPQPGTAYGYGYPQPPAYNGARTRSNPWAQNDRNSWIKSGRNSWRNTGRNSWSNTGRNEVTNRNRNPWAAPNPAVNPPQNSWGGNPWAAPDTKVNPPQKIWGGSPYYAGRQPVFAPRYGNPWQADARPPASGYNPAFPPLYRRDESKTEANTTSRNARGVYPNYNWGPFVPLYGAAPGLR